MRKVILIIIAALLYASAYSQIPSNRSSASVTAVDQRVWMQLNGKMPVMITDTVGALKGGIDSIGLFIWVKAESKMYVRDTVVGGGHKWTLINVGGTGGGGISQVVAGSCLTQINDSTLAADTSCLATRWWVDSLIANSGFGRINSIRGNAPIKIDSTDPINPIVYADTSYYAATHLQTQGRTRNQLDSLGALKLNISDTAAMLNRYLVSTYRTPGVDSLYFVTRAGNVFALKDSVGAGIDTASFPSNIVDSTGLNLYQVPYAVNKKFYGSNRFLYDSVNSRLLVNFTGIPPGTTSNKLNINGNSYFNGNVGIGTNDPAAKFNIVQESNADIFITEANTTGFGANWLQRRSRGSNASKTIVQSGDIIGGMIAAAYDGSAYRNAGRIAFNVDGTPGSSDMPGRIEFRTTPDGSATEQVRMVIKNNGNVGIGTATPDASALLDVSSTSKGVLIPRMSNTNMNAIGSPATGLLVWNTTDSSLYGYRGTTGGWQTGARYYNPANKSFISYASGSGGSDANARNYLDGEGAGLSLTTGTGNYLAGYNAGKYITTQSGIVAIGNNALSSASLDAASVSHIAIGNGALQSNTTGLVNLAIGSSALTANTTGTQNTAIGYTALFNNTTGFSNTAIGGYSMRGMSTGQQNTAIGSSAMYQMPSGSYNVAVGSSAMSSPQNTGSYNVAIGFNAGQRAYGSGADNVYIGAQAGEVGHGSVVYDASQNIAIGRSAATLSSINRSITIGAYASARDTGSVRKMVIGLRSGFRHQFTYRTTIIGDSLCSAWNETATPMTLTNSVYIGGGVRSTDTVSADRLVIGLNDGYAAITGVDKTSYQLNATTTALPTVNTSAALEVLTTTKVIILGKMTRAERLAISTGSNTIGGIVYQTDTDGGDNEGYWVYKSDGWHYAF